MNKKQLIIAALATVMSLSAAHATTNITGADLQNGVYNINPEKINGEVGYRQYSNFQLDQGDIAKLIYEGRKNGQLRDLSTFINLVDNQVKINGILNAVKADGTGHAIFITPQGMTVGSQGVLNVGTLSVITPTTTKFNSLMSDYGNDDFTNINQINKMRNNATINNNNYGGNADVAVDGYVFARNGVDIRGAQVNVNGGIVNGYKPHNDFTTSDFDGKSTAAALFNSLVNTDGIAASANQILNNGTGIVIKSGAGDYNRLNVTNGKVVNLANGETALTNHGDRGLTLDGATVFTNGKLNVYNNNAEAALTVSNGSKLAAEKTDLSLSSKGGLDVRSGNTLNAYQNLEIVNKGNALTFNGTALANGKIDVYNHEGAENATINGTLGNASTDSVRIVNRNGKLTFAADARAQESVSLRNYGDEGMQVNGSINAGEGVLVQNEAGDLGLNGSIEVAGAKVENGIENVAVAVYNKGTDGQLTTGTSSTITADDGNIAIKNNGYNGMTLAGTITNKKGETAINNTKGSMDVNGTINNRNGHMGIINNGAGKMTVGAEINSNGKLKIANVKGNGLDITGNVTNENGNFNVYNEEGKLKVSGKLENSDGFLFVYSRNNSDGITTTAASTIKNTNGDLAIKNDALGSDGIDLNGKIIKDGTNGELAINNFDGDMHVGGNIETNAQTAIRNRAGSDNMTVDATIASGNTKELRIQNMAGTGNMEVAGNITHNGRLNVLANEGTLTLSGDITNNGSDRTYAIARGQADGIEVTQDFNANSTNGMIYILNKVGNDGLTYKGSAKSTKGQVELYNMKGDMVVNGGTLQGGSTNTKGSTVILNKGNKLTVTNAATVTGPEVKIVNKGTTEGEIGSNHLDHYYEQLKTQQ